MPSLLGDLAILNIGSEDFNNRNRGRVDHNDFDSSNSESWNRSRGHKSRGHKGGHKGHSKDC